MCIFCKAAHLQKTFIGRLTLGSPAALRSVSSHNDLRALDSDRSRSRRSVSLCIFCQFPSSTRRFVLPLTSRQNLIIMRPQLLSILAPRIKMRLDINTAPNTLLLPDRPKLLERARSINRRLVGSRRLQNVVRAAVSGDGALLLSSRSGVVRAVGFDNVVLDQGVARPAVQRDV
jgi:hypothetical protein